MGAVRRRYLLAITEPVFAPRSFIGSLLPAERTALLEIGRPRDWGSGEAVLRMGDPVDSALVILAGRVKIHRSAPAGAEVILALSGAGDLLGEISAVGEAVRSASATALEPVRAIVIPASRLRSFLVAHPRATLALLELALTRLGEANSRRIEFGTSETLARVSSRLVELAERFGERRSGGTIEIELPITQEELASWSAASKESTARALRTLRELGVIQTHRMRVTVPDLARLAVHAGRMS